MMESVGIQAEIEDAQLNNINHLGGTSLLFLENFMFDFMTNKNSKEKFNSPFNKNGKPKKYLEFLIPFLVNADARLTKEEILKAAGKDTSKIDVGGYLSSTFSSLNAFEILQFEKGKRTWSRGENFMPYFFYVFQEFLEYAEHKELFIRYIKTYENNVLELIEKSQ
jgi:hypothetical protein